MSTEQSESTPTVTAHTQGETQAAPAVDVTQHSTTPTATTSTQRVKIPSVWPLEKWLLKERGWPGSNRKKQLRLIWQATRRKPPQRPPSQPRLQKAKVQSAAEKEISASAPPNGLLLPA